MDMGDLYKLFVALLSCARNNSISKQTEEKYIDELIDDVISWLDGRKVLIQFINFTIREKTNELSKKKKKIGKKILKLIILKLK